MQTGSMDCQRQADCRQLLFTHRICGFACREQRKTFEEGLEMHYATFGRFEMGYTTSLLCIACGYRKEDASLWLMQGGIFLWLLRFRCHRMARSSMIIT